MADNLIICPVGMKIPTDPRWKDEEHWRWTNNNRDYETLVVVYNDFEPEPNSYDYILKTTGHKWQIMREVGKHFPVNKYKYIGCVDDDLVTDYHSFNDGLSLANKFNFQYWQLSMPEDSDLHPNYHNCLKNDPNCTFSETTFIEMGSCFFTTEKFNFLMDFISHWDMKIAWGIDKTFFDLFQCPANVVHSSMIHQPVRESYYDKTAAQIEMDDYLYNKYPQILKTYYNRESNFQDIPVTLKKYKVYYD